MTMIPEDRFVKIESKNFLASSTLILFFSELKVALFNCAVMLLNELTNIPNSSFFP